MANKEAIIGKINYKPELPVKVKNFDKVVTTAVKNHKGKAKDIKIGDSLRLDKMKNRVGTNFNK
jgi:hypothetical protein